MGEIGVDRREVVPAHQRVEQLAAHFDQRTRGLRRQIEPAQQFQPPRLGCRMKLGGANIGGLVSPCLHGGLDAGPIGAEACCQRLEKRDAGTDGKIVIAREDLAR